MIAALGGFLILENPMKKKPTLKTCLRAISKLSGKIWRLEMDQRELSEQLMIFHQRFGRSMEAAIRYNDGPVLQYRVHRNATVGTLLTLAHVPFKGVRIRVNGAISISDHKLELGDLVMVDDIRKKQR